jgi:Ca-activated chloride channel homolog
MSDFSDHWIDEQLRDVPLPAELLPRLREIAALGDREIDTLLRDVSLPADLAARLHAIGSLTDTDLDDDARHVAVPRTLVPRLRRAVRQQVRYSQLGRLAIAATLLLAFGGAGWLLVSRFKPGDGEIIAHRNERPPGADRSQPQATSPTKSSALPVEPKTAQAAESNRPDPHPVHPPAAASNDAVAVSPVTPPDEPEAIEPAVADDRPVPAPTSPIAGVLGNSALVTQPNLRMARGLVRQGVIGPRIKGYDLLFEFNKGEHPAVHPAAAAALTESQAPVWTETGSYEMAGRVLAARQPLPASQVHAEDFLAAMDYGFSTPPAGVGIRTAAGPSPLGSPGTNLLQIGVQAHRLDRSKESPVNLTLAIDASNSVIAERHWALLRRALVDLADQLGPRDQVSLVLIMNRPVVMAEAAHREQLKRAIAQLEEIESTGTSDLAGGLATAAKLTHQNAQPSRLILLTGGIDWLDPAAIPQTVKLLRDTAAAGIMFRVVDVRPDEVNDSSLEELARAGGRAGDSEVHHAPTTRALSRELREALFGRRDVAAASVNIKIKFNPEAVESYRLVGHDPLAAGGLVSGPLEGDLRSGEAATVLYEVELKPDGPNAIANVEISWHEPGSEQIRHMTQTIGRLQFVPSWTEAPLSLQLATLASETAAILRGSSFAPAGPRPLDQVADLADRTNPLLQSRESFQELKWLLESARAARPSGR